MWERKPRPPVGEQGMSKRYRDDPTLASNDEGLTSSPVLIAFVVGVVIVLGVVTIAVYAISATSGRHGVPWISALSLLLIVANAVLQLGLRRPAFPTERRRRGALITYVVFVVFCLALVAALVIPGTPQWLVLALAVVSAVFVVGGGAAFLPYDRRAPSLRSPDEGSQDAQARLDDAG